MYPIKDDYGTSLGDLPIKAITTELVVKILTPIWYTKPKMAERVRYVLSMVFDYARVRYKVPENPARWDDHLSVLFPRPDDVAPVQHYRALPFARAPELYARLRGRRMFARNVATLLLLLAPVRKSALIKAEWKEFDLVNRVWRVPAIRMKSHRKVKYPNDIFDMPLSETAVALLIEWKTERRSSGRYVFPGLMPDTHVAGEGINLLLRDLGDETTPHGFRAMLKSWADIRTVCEVEVKKMVLGHSLGDKTEEAYSREDWYEKRSILMDVWGEFLETGIDQPTIIGFREDARMILSRGAEPIIVPGFKRRSERLEGQIMAHDSTWPTMGHGRSRRDRQLDGRPSGLGRRGGTSASL